LADEALAFCAVEYDLKVDDVAAPPPADFSAFGAPVMIAPAGARQVTVDPTRGDPRNETFAVVIWKARS
jgi:hypothetical protein